MRANLPGALAQRLRGRPFYGWYIVGTAFVCLFVQASMAGFTFGIFLPAMSADLGWSRSTIVLAASLSSITAAVAGPLLGRVVDQRGPRLVLILSVLLMGGGLATSGLAEQPWHFYLTYGLMCGIARSALQSVIPGSMIANWFVRRRSAGYSVAAMGPPVANFLLPPVMAGLVAAMGWRMGFLGLSAICLGLALAPALLLVRRRPEDLGLRPDGEPPDSVTSTQAGGCEVRRPAPHSEEWTAHEAFHSPAFWMVVVGMALILLAPYVCIVFMFSYLTDKGFEPGAAATAVATVSAMQVLSRLVFWAPITARLSNIRWVVLLWGSLLLCASLLLALAPGGAWAFAAAVILGCGLGGNLVLHLQIWPQYFGRTAIGTIIGTAQAFQGTTNAVVPLLLAALLDRTGSYTALYLIVAVLVAIGLTLHAVVGKPRKPEIGSRASDD